jgi:N-acetylmuramic acid 6-phosphate etherase
MERILGIDGGGTKTGWMLAEQSGAELRVLQKGKLPGTNLRLTSREQLRAIFAQLPREVDRVGAFLAGCATEEDRAQLGALCREIWPAAKILTGSDRDSGFAACFGEGEGIVVNAGTGSAVTGRRAGCNEKAGGWGHILGDAGGGYYLAVEGLRLVLREYDLHRGELHLAASILRALCLNNLDELVRWAQTAGKMEVATLMPVVFDAAQKGDAHVQQLLCDGARVLAEYTAAVASRLDWPDPEVKLLGGLFESSDLYVSAFRQELAGLRPRAVVSVAKVPRAFGAAWLAARSQAGPETLPILLPAIPAPALASASTEEINPRSELLESLSARELVELFVDEEQFVAAALRAKKIELATAVEMVAEALRKGGRLFYVGAGTSGRLGMLDASEIPPTFGASPDLIQGIIAGGASALHRSVEGAEDEREAGALTIMDRDVGGADIVCGITASGRTPFVLGALEQAARLKAHTILLSCNPNRSRTQQSDLEIDLPTGPELLTGSTRLKAGTATKVALNIISTGAMVALGKVCGNLMIDLVASNEKLRDRAARLVMQMSKCSYEEAVRRLEREHWNLRAALQSS